MNKMEPDPKRPRAAGAEELDVQLDAERRDLALSILAQNFPETVARLRVDRASAADLASLDPVLRMIRDRPSESEILARLASQPRVSDFSAHKQAPLRFCAVQGYADCVDFLLARPGVSVADNAYQPLAVAFDAAESNPNSTQFRILQSMYTSLSPEQQIFAKRLIKAKLFSRKTPEIRLVEFILPWYQYQVELPIGIAEFNDLAKDLAYQMITSYDAGDAAITPSYLISILRVLFAQTDRVVDGIIRQTISILIKNRPRDAEFRAFVVSDPDTRFYFETNGWTYLSEFVVIDDGPSHFSADNMRTLVDFLLDNFEVSVSDISEMFIGNLLVDDDEERFVEYVPVIREMFQHPKIQSLLSNPENQASFIRQLSQYSNHDGLFGSLLLEAIRPLVTQEQYDALVYTYISFEDI
jgi:hypothetical protein